MSGPAEDHGRRLEELETRLAFQDDLIERLDGVVARQDRELLQLSQRLERLERRVRELAETQQAAGGPGGHEVPPHY